MSLQDDQNPECPLCMEPFEMDDFNFFPCTCGYQICRFCWHRIRTDENGLCPACRKQYPEDPADFKPLSVEELQKIKSEKRQKDQQKKQKMSESRKHLANVRVVQKNLVFVVGLPTRLADAEVLKKFDYFGKFGKIHKVVVNQSTSYAGSQVISASHSQGPSASAYVTYCKAEDALRAIKSVNNVQVDGRTLKASLGTTKYCSHFLKNQQCPKTDCMYLHELGDEAASFTKEDMQQGKHQDYEKKLQDQMIGSNNRKQTASPPPSQSSQNSVSETWPCTIQTVKESRSSRTKEASQSQRTESKSSRSKNKHASDGQKSKKSKNKSADSVQNNHCSSKHSKEEGCGPSSRKIQKGKHKESNNNLAQPSGHSPGQQKRYDEPAILDAVLELNSKNAQTTYVHIAETQPKPVSASIQIARSESPVPPSSPISSSSSSLFTPFGSLSSNFLSSSSPSPPPSNGSGSSHSQEEGGGSASPVESFAAPAQILEMKSQSPPGMFGSVESDSLFSHMNYLPTSSECGTFGGLHSEEPSNTDSSDWSSNYSYEDLQKPEDDLDFDPWNESSKGLADLLAKESVHNPNFSEMPTPPGFFQPIKTPVPNQQRVSVPPPGFCNRQIPHSNSLNHLPGMYSGPNSDFLSCKLPPLRQQINGCSQFFSQDQQSQIPLQNQFKQQQFPHPNSRENPITEALRLRKVEEQFRYLLPDMFYQFNSRNLQKSQNQNGSTWNHPVNNLSWLANETNMLNSGNVTEGGQRANNAIWVKAISQLTLEDNSNQFNGHPSYTNAFALRGQWPTAQCPPPGFVAPSRSSVNTPYQHMPVNQKI